MDLALEILEWAKDKDLAELYYENQGPCGPCKIHLLFEPTTQKLTQPQQCLAYISSPALGLLVFNADKIKEGSVVAAGEVLAYVESNGARDEIVSPYAGKIIELLVASGKGVGYHDNIFLVAVAAQ